MDIVQITERFVSAHRKGSPVSISADDAALSAEDAYSIQHQVFGALYGGQPRAWKVGWTGPSTDPNAAPIAHSCVYPSPATINATAFQMIGVEIEIAFRMGRDLPARASPYSDDEVAAAIAETIVAIEICDTRLADLQSAPPAWKLADFQSNAGLVAGSGSGQVGDIDFTTVRGELWIDGQKKNEAVGAHPLGNPARLLPWLASHAGRRAGGLRAGDVVTTGSWTGMDLVTPGTEVVARFPGLGEARVTIAR